jgi:hypothetical protein
VRLHHQTLIFVTHIEVAFARGRLQARPINNGDRAATMAYTSTVGKDRFSQVHARFADRGDYAALCARVRTLTEARWSVPAIARQLEAHGYAPWRPGRSWTVAHVVTLRRQLGLNGQHHRGRSCEILGLADCWAADLARTLGMTRTLQHTWIQRGIVRARQEAHGMHRWIVQADASAVERLRQYRQRDIASEMQPPGPPRTSCQDGSARRNRMPDQKRPIGLEAGSSSGRSCGSGAAGGCVATSNSCPPRARPGAI